MTGDREGRGWKLVPKGGKGSEGAGSRRTRLRKGAASNTRKQGGRKGPAPSDQQHHPWRRAEGVIRPSSGYLPAGKGCPTPWGSLGTSNHAAREAGARDSHGRPGGGGGRKEAMAWVACQHATSNGAMASDLYRETRGNVVPPPRP